MNRKGMEVQINDALTVAGKPGGSVRVENIVDDRLVVELEKNASSIGFTNSDVEDLPNRDRKRSSLFHRRAGVRFAGSPRVC